MSAPVELRTKRLLLRPFRIDDADDVFAYSTDSEWGRYLVNIPEPFTRQDAEEFVARFSDPSQWDKTSMFAMVLKKKVIGQVYLNAPDAVNKPAELGYMLSRTHWGKGYAPEAACAVMDWGFKTIGLHKIIATCDVRNESSWRVMEKLGMVREGTLRSNLKWHGEFRDEFHYGILRSDWKICHFS